MSALDGVKICEEIKAWSKHALEIPNKNNLLISLTIQKI